MSIKFQGVSKIFHRHTRQKLIRNHLGDRFRRNPEHDFYALKNVSFEVGAGERVGIVGRNGAGKSTLLSLVCGLAQPEKGRVEVSGRIASAARAGLGISSRSDRRGKSISNASLLGSNAHGPGAVR